MLGRRTRATSDGARFSRPPTTRITSPGTRCTTSTWPATAPRITTRLVPDVVVQRRPGPLGTVLVGEPKSHTDREDDRDDDGIGALTHEK
jgi:hypothetical protein